MWRIGLASLAAGAAVLWSAPAFAQRGGDYVDQDLSPVKHTNSGFPGMFDTELVKKGATTGSLPWLNVHAGVTDNLTVGTNLVYFLPMFGLQPSGLLLTRYRVNSTATTETTMDVMVGGMRLDTDDTKINSFVGVFGSNTLIVLSEDQHLILNALGGTFSFGFEDKETESYTDLSLYGVLLGATYRLSLADWASFQATVLPLSYMNGRMDSSAALLEIDVSRPAAFETVLYRGNFSFRTGRWLFELGALGLVKHWIPWLNVGLEIGG